MISLFDTKLSNFTPFNRASLEISNGVSIVKPKQTIVQSGLRIPNVRFNQGEVLFNIDVEIIKCNCFFVIEKNGEFEMKKMLINGENTFKHYITENDVKVIKIIMQNVNTAISQINIKNYEVEEQNNTINLDTIEISESIIKNDKKPEVRPKQNIVKDVENVINQKIKNDEKIEKIDKIEKLEKKINDVNNLLNKFDEIVDGVEQPVYHEDNEEFINPSDIVSTESQVYTETLTETINNQPSSKPKQKSISSIKGVRTAAGMKKRRTGVAPKIVKKVDIDYHAIIDIKSQTVDYSYRFNNAHHFAPSMYQEYPIINAHIELLEYLLTLSDNNNIFLISEKASVSRVDFKYSVLAKLNDYQYDIAVLTHSNESNNVFTKATQQNIYYYPGAYVIKRQFIKSFISLLKLKLNETKLNVIKLTDYDIFNTVIKSILNKNFVVMTPNYFKLPIMPNTNNYFTDLSLIISDNGYIRDFIDEIPKNIELIIITNNVIGFNDRPYITITSTTFDYEDNYKLGLQYANANHVSFVYSSWRIPPEFFTAKLTDLTFFRFKFFDNIYSPVITKDKLYAYQVFIANKSLIEDNIEQSLLNIINKDMNTNIVECDNLVCKLQEEIKIKEKLSNYVINEANGKENIEEQITVVEKKIIEKVNEDQEIHNVKKILTTQINDIISKNIDLSKDTFVIISSNEYVDIGREMNIAKSICKYFNVVYVIDKRAATIDFVDGVFYTPINIYGKITDKINVNRIIVYYQDPCKYTYITTLERDYTIFDLTANIFTTNKFTNVYENNSILNDNIVNANIVFYSSMKFKKILDNYKTKSFYIQNTVFEKVIEELEESDYTRLREIKKNKIIVGYMGYVNNDLDFNMIKNISSNNDIHVVIIGGLNEEMDNEFKNLNISLVNNSYDLSFPNNNISWFAFKKNNLAYLNLFDISFIPFKINNYTESKNPSFMYESIKLHKPILSTIDYANIENKDINLYLIDKNTYDDKLNDCVQLVKCDIDNDYKEDNNWNSVIDNLYSIIQNQGIDFTNDMLVNKKTYGIIGNDFSISNKIVIDAVCKMLEESGFEKNDDNCDIYISTSKPINKVVDNLIVIEFDNFDSYYANEESKLATYDMLSNALMIITNDEKFKNYAYYDISNIYNKIHIINYSTQVKHYNRNFYYVSDKDDGVYDNLVKIMNIYGCEQKIIKENRPIDKIMDIRYDSPVLVNAPTFVANILRKNGNKIFNFTNYLDFIDIFINKDFDTVQMFDQKIRKLFMNYGIISTAARDGMATKSLFTEVYDRKYIMDNFDKFWKNYVIECNILKDGVNTKDLAFIHFKVNERFKEMEVINRNYDFKLGVVIGSNIINYQLIVVRTLMRYFDCDVYSYGTNEINNLSNIIYSPIYENEELFNVINDYDIVLYYDIPFSIEKILSTHSKCISLMMNNNINYDIINYLTFSNKINNQLRNKLKNEEYNIDCVDYLISDKYINIPNVQPNRNICCVASVNKNDTYNSYCNVESYIKCMSRMKKKEIDIILYNTEGINTSHINELLNSLNIKGNIIVNNELNQLINTIAQYQTIVIPDKSTEMNIITIYGVMLNRRVIVSSTQANIEFNNVFRDRMKTNKNIIEIFNYNDIESMKNVINTENSIDYDTVNYYLGRAYMRDDAFVSKMFYVFLKHILA